MAAELGAVDILSGGVSFYEAAKTREGHKMFSTHATDVRRLARELQIVAIGHNGKGVLLSAWHLVRGMECQERFWRWSLISYQRDK
ncbi:MAG: hypothetical protein J2P36_01355 [Ktedonobacteraceae bacterium]|nr:hypothetical protein [Ktedonobacteraceae bacterium]